MPLVGQSKVLTALAQNIGSVPLPGDLEGRAPAPSNLLTIGLAFHADNACWNGC